MIKWQNSEIFKDQMAGVFLRMSLRFSAEEHDSSSVSVWDAGLRWLNALLRSIVSGLHFINTRALGSICCFRSVSLKGQQPRDWCLENKLRGEDECKAERRTFIDGHHLESLCSPFFTPHERVLVLKLIQSRNLWVNQTELQNTSTNHRRKHLHKNSTFNKSEKRWL